MKVFKTPGFKYIFYLEITLILSALISVLVFFFFNLFQTKQILYIDPYEGIYDQNNRKNYQVFNQLLAIKIETKVDNSTIDSRFMNALKQLNEIENSLNQRGSINIYQLVSDIPREFSIIKQKKEYLYYKWLYLKKRYEEFVLGYPKLMINKDELDLLYINSLIKLNKRAQALEKFKNVFKVRGINDIKGMISTTNFDNLMSNLDKSYWKEKLFYMLDKNRFSEFKRIKKYIKDQELKSLIEAFFRYKKRGYDQTREILKNVTKEEYLPYKHALLAKIKVRRDIYSNIHEDLTEARKDDGAYNILLLNLGKIFFLKNKPDQSVQYFTELIKDYEKKRITRDLFYGELVWMNIGNYFRKGKEKNKAQLLELLAKGCNVRQISLRTACIYWINKLTYEKQNTLFYPYNYYSLISNPDWRRLYFIGVETFLKKIRNIQNHELLNFLINEVKILLKYNRIKEILNLLEGEIKYSSRLNDSEKRFLRVIMAIVLVKKKNYNLAFKKYVRDISDIQMVIPPYFLKDIFFPLNYRDKIDNYAKLYNLDPIIIYSIIREESFFSKTALSYAGANGLMQLMQGTANRMREDNGRYLKKKDLHDPELNIKLGCKYLRFLLDRYDDKLHLALAAYNAGTTYVDSWVNAYPKHKKEEFIESIPIEATRGYVKKIFRDYFFYSFYYNKVE